MASLSEVFRTINELKSEGVLEDYAVGGAMAVLFYAEPSRTYDLDVFVFLPPAARSGVLLAPLYAWLGRRGFSAAAEHVLIHGVPVQFLPAHNDLVDEAVEQAQSLDYQGVLVRVVRPEHLVALAVQAAGRKRREHVARLFDSGTVDRDKLQDILGRYGLLDAWRARWDQIDA